MQKHPYQIVCATLAGVSFVAVTQLVTRDTLDQPLFWAVGLFSIALPLLTWFALWPVPEDIVERPSWPKRIRIICFFLGIAVCLIALACLFGHFAWYFGVVFILLSTFAFLMAPDAETVSTIEEPQQETHPSEPSTSSDTERNG